MAFSQLGFTQTLVEVVMKIKKEELEKENNCHANNLMKEELYKTVSEDWQENPMENIQVCDIMCSTSPRLSVKLKLPQIDC